MEQSTKQFRKRNAILTCLRGTDTHPGADWIYEQVKQDIPDISLATVYRNLALFKAQGTIQSVATVKGVERFDGNTEPHVHFICTGCGKIQDLPQMEIPAQLNREAARHTGSTIHSCQLSFTGICPDCEALN